jgi:two-component sensor histidine kinase
MYGVNVDITASKLLEQSREQMLAYLEDSVQARTRELMATLKEREVLLQEVHHRVKNNLQVIVSLINLQLDELRDDAGRDALEECQKRVHAIALIHEQLYQSNDYAHVPFSEYAKSLANNIFDVAGISRHAVSLDLAIEDIALPVDKAIPCGLMLNELLTNALKHAFPDGRTGTVRIELTSDMQGSLILVVRDDGIGLPEDFEVGQSKTLGSQLVRILAKQMDGVLEFGSANGTVCRLTIPLGE